MNSHAITLKGHGLEALASGCLWWPSERLLAVADLHLGRSERLARFGGPMLPPYEVADTLDRLEAVIRECAPSIVLCLGDSFDDLGAAAMMEEPDLLHLMRLQAGREWVWVTGNHDPGPIPLPGSQVGTYRRHGLTFRHIAEHGASGEVSGHYHPKAGIRGASGPRACFLADEKRIILPAFGTFTGGLHSYHPALTGLMGDDAVAVLTGRRACPVPMPRQR